jgi:hypothetical protein
MSKGKTLEEDGFFSYKPTVRFESNGTWFWITMEMTDTSFTRDGGTGVDVTIPSSGTSTGFLDAAHDRG